MSGLFPYHGPAHPLIGPSAECEQHEVVPGSPLATKVMCLSYKVRTGPNRLTPADPMRCRVMLPALEPERRLPRSVPFDVASRNDYILYVWTRGLSIDRATRSAQTSLDSRHSEHFFGLVLTNDEFIQMMGQLEGVR